VPRLFDRVGVGKGQRRFRRGLVLPTVAQGILNSVRQRVGGGFAHPSIGQVGLDFADCNADTGVTHNNDSRATKGPASRRDVIRVTSATSIRS